MNSNNFMKLLDIKSIEESNEIRGKYISNFIDSSCDHYVKYIKDIKKFSDGFCYIGYLWDCIKAPELIDFDLLRTYYNSDKLVNIFWDIHSKDNIFIENYWKFGKENVIKLKYGLLFDNYDLFPEDIYIFDDSFEWTIILTHEFINTKRMCFILKK